MATSQWLRLKDNHPTMIKLMKLYDLAEELGIHLSFTGHACVVEDDERDAKLPMMRLEDIEGDSYDVSEWPPTTEFKVIFENPAYLAEEAAKTAERNRIDAEKTKVRSEAAKKAAETRTRQEAEAKEARERVQLADLRKKYGE
jgi:hypothetical protein